MGQLATLDWLLIGLYFAVILGVAWWVAGRKKATHESSTGYFLAGRNVGWFVVGTALFASNIGSEHLVGLAGTGYDSGVAVGQFEVLASLILLILGWLFVPFYLKSGVYTMQEFLERRYSPAARWYLAAISIVGYVLTKISVTIAAGSTSTTIDLSVLDDGLVEATETAQVTLTAITSGDPQITIDGAAATARNSPMTTTIADESFASMPVSRRRPKTRAESEDSSTTTA